MFSYMAFFNNTSIPLISIYADDICIIENIPQHIKTKYHVFDSGSICIAVYDKHLTLLSDFYLSLYPLGFYTLKLNDSFAEFI